MEPNTNLRDRTILIAGDLSATTQTLVQYLTQSGADCVLLSEDIKMSEKFAQLSNDMREVNEKFGRCAAVKAQFQTRQSLHESIQDVTKIFGGIDCLIDFSFSALRVDFFQDAFDVQALMQVQLARSLSLVQEVMPFLKSKKKGRIVGLGYETQLNPIFGDLYGTALRGGLPAFYQALAREVQSFAMTANWISLGVTEEYLLKNAPQTKSVKEALEQMKTKHPEVRIMEPERLAHMILFLLSPAGQGMTGQVLSCR